MYENLTSLSDYIAILRRRKFQIIVPALLILSLSAFVAFSLPSVYRSTATIMIEEQEVPPELIQSTVTSYASERIRIITEFIMTRANLLNIIEKYELYPELRREGKLEELLSEMRKSIEVIPVDAEIVERRSGKPSKATIAFEVSFESSTPESAKNVTEELVDLFLQENAKLRTQSAESTREFLAREATRLSEKVNELETKLAVYKEKNMGQLPELFDFNLTLAQRAEEELDATQREIYALEERKSALLSQLSQVEPYSGNSPQMQLRELQTELLEAKGKYAPGHPDRVRLEKKAELLKQQIGGANAPIEQLKQQAKQLHSELETARSKYSEQHPDVIKLKRALEVIESGINKTASEEAGEISIKPDNPAYISIQSQLEAIDIRLKAEREKKDKIQTRIKKYQTRIEKMPRIEQEGLALRRGYENAIQQYNEIQEKLLRAQIASQLEQEHKGETFSVLDSPMLPTSPYKPNRLAILFIGVFFSFTSGIGYAGFSEYLDTTVRGVKGVKAVLQAAPLVAIPYIEQRGANIGDQIQQKKKTAVVIGTILFGIALVIVFMVYLLRDSPINHALNPEKLPDLVSRERIDGQ
jgi:polysaccharide biosynthesis transport protein